MLTFTITADGTSAAQVLEGSERGPRTVMVRAKSADWESASLKVETSPPTANPPAYLPLAGGDALTEDTQIPLTAVRGHFVRVFCTSKSGTTPIVLTIE